MQNYLEDILKSYESSSKNYLVDKIDFYDISLLSYHKIDMLFYDQIAVNKSSLANLKEKKNRIEFINSGYINIAQQLSEKLKNNNILHVFLKGLFCSLNIYKKIWHRYYNDIDLLVEKSQINNVEIILKNMGYTFASEMDDGKNIRPATRSEILFQKTFTHEMHNMARVEDGWVSNIDVNFLFSWNGVEGDNNISLIDFKDHVITIDGLCVFDDIINMLHMCCHLYNEAFFFALDRNFVGGDPKEILLNRVIDIAIIAQRMTEKDFCELFNISRKLQFNDKLEYAITLINHLLGLNIAVEYGILLTNNCIDMNYYITKEKKIKMWPITIYERVFELEKKLKVAEKLFPYMDR